MGCYQIKCWCGDVESMDNELNATLMAVIFSGKYI